MSYLDVTRRQEFERILTGRPAPVIHATPAPTTVNLLDLLVKMSETISNLQDRIGKLEHPGPGVRIVGGDANSGGRPPPMK